MCAPQGVWRRAWTCAVRKPGSWSRGLSATSPISGASAQTTEYHQRVAVNDHWLHYSRHICYINQRFMLATGDRLDITRALSNRKKDCVLFLQDEHLIWEHLHNYFQSSADYCSTRWISSDCLEMFVIWSPSLFCSWRSGDPNHAQVMCFCCCCYYYYVIVRISAGMWITEADLM